MAARFFLLRRLPACKDIVPLMSQSMERALTFRERFILNTHLLICAWCAWYFEHLHKMRGMLRNKVNEEPPVPSDGPGLSLEARERLKAALSKSSNP
ncbi:MAG: hypothetical protein QOH96_2519 [Blastocatellia bacterium]|nr:hypothetical protein [Blastocatellia bacterium]